MTSSRTDKASKFPNRTGDGKEHFTCCIKICNNSLEGTPNKIFVTIPSSIDLHKWKPVLKPFLRKNTYVCEDHFDFEDELKTNPHMTIREVITDQIKKGVLPSKSSREFQYCCIKGCENSRILTPAKIFMPLPGNPVLREKWKDFLKPALIKSKSRIVFCEDHFPPSNNTTEYYDLMDFIVSQVESGVLPVTTTSGKPSLIDMMKFIDGQLPDHSPKNPNISNPTPDDTESSNCHSDALTVTKVKVGPSDVPESVSTEESKFRIKVRNLDSLQGSVPNSVQAQTPDLLSNLQPPTEPVSLCKAINLETLEFEDIGAARKKAREMAKKAHKIKNKGEAGKSLLPSSQTSISVSGRSISTKSLLKTIATSVNNIVKPARPECMIYNLPVGTVIKPSQPVKKKSEPAANILKKVTVFKTDKIFKPGNISKFPSTPQKHKITEEDAARNEGLKRIKIEPGIVSQLPSPPQKHKIPEEDASRIVDLKRIKIEPDEAIDESIRESEEIDEETESNEEMTENSCTNEKMELLLPEVSVEEDSPESPIHEELFAIEERRSNCPEFDPLETNEEPQMMENGWDEVSIGSKYQTVLDHNYFSRKGHGAENVACSVCFRVFYISTPVGHTSYNIHLEYCQKRSFACVVCNLSQSTPDKIFSHMRDDHKLKIMNMRVGPWTESNQKLQMNNALNDLFEGVDPPTIQKCYPSVDVMSLVHCGAKMTLDLIGEQDLAMHLYHLQKLHFVLSEYSIRRIAYEFMCKTQGISCLESKIADGSWFSNFTRKFPAFKYEEMKFAHPSAEEIYNRSVVNLFFDQYVNLIVTQKFSRYTVFTVETASASIVIAQKGQKVQRSQISVITALNSEGDLTPGVMTSNEPLEESQRIKYEHQTRCSIDSNAFKSFISILIPYIKANYKGEALLLINGSNYYSQSYDVFDMLRTNNISVLCVPNCLVKLQPLSRGIFASIFDNMQALIDAGMYTNISDCPDMFETSCGISPIRQMAWSGFAYCGLGPFDREAAFEWLKNPNSKRNDYVITFDSQSQNGLKISKVVESRLKKRHVEPRKSKKVIVLPEVKVTLERLSPEVLAQYNVEIPALKRSQRVSNKDVFRAAIEEEKRTSKLLKSPKKQSPESDSDEKLEELIQKRDQMKMKRMGLKKLPFESENEHRAQSPETKNSPKKQETNKNSPKKQETTKNSPKTQETTKNSPKTQETTKNCPKNQEITKNSAKTQETTKNSPKKQETTKNCAKTPETTKNSAKTQEITKNGVKTQETTKSSPKKQEITKNSAKTQEMTKNSPKKQEMTKNSATKQEKTKNSAKKLEMTKNSSKTQETFKNDAKKLETTNKNNKTQESSPQKQEMNKNRLKTPEISPRKQEIGPQMPGTTEIRSEEILETNETEEASLRKRNRDQCDDISVRRSKRRTIEKESSKSSKEEEEKVELTQFEASKYLKKMPPDESGGSKKASKLKLTNKELLGYTKRKKGRRKVRCLACGALYGKSNGGSWIKCMSCKKWAHENCAVINDLYYYYCDTCQNKKTS